MAENVWTPENAECVHSPYSPFYPEGPITYAAMLTPFLQPYEFTGWRDEQLSWETTCYIHGNLNPTPTYRISGPGAKDFLSKYCVNSFESFPVGSGKHGFTCDEEGNITSDGCLLRNDEDVYTSYWMMTLAMMAQIDGENFDMKFEDITSQVALLQVGGPKSLQTIERVFQQDLHGIRFNRTQVVEYKGSKVEIFRMGMAGSLAYELHLPIELSQGLYDAIYEAGKDLGIRRLGLRTYLMQHAMNGFPQFGQHYGVAGYTTEGSVAGSMADMPLANYFHNPFETGQGYCVKFDHDFVGKEALLAAKDNHRVMVSLEWDADDVADIFRSQMTDDSCMPIDGPVQYDTTGILTYHDKVLNAEGELVGASTGRTYTLYYHKMISICYLDPAYAEEGTQLTLIWGNPDTRQKEIKVTVARFPYFNECSNKDFDVESVPHYQA